MTPRHFAWQAWHLVTSTGRFTWQAWHNLFTLVLRGRRGTHGTGWRARARSSCGWPRHFAWQAWHLVTSTVRFTWQAWHNLTFTLVLRGMRGTHGTGWRAWARFSCGWPRHFAWQAWHLVTSTVRFTWQAWHNLTFTLVLRGRRGTHGTGWRAWACLSRGWHLGTLRGRRGTWSHPPFVSRGRCGAISHPPWFCVAGVAQSHIHLGLFVAGVALMALTTVLGPVLVAGDAAAVCVAGVALGDIHVRFMWQGWHNLTSTFVLRGRRGTIFDTPSFTHHFVTHQLSHTTLSHTTLSHTIFHHTIFHTPLCHHTIFHTQLCHTPSLTLHLSHTTLSHTIFDRPSFTHHLCNTPSFTHHYVTHHLSPHHPSHTTLSHTPSFTTPSFTHNFVTHHLSPHHLSHTTLSHTMFRHTIFHTQLCHIPSFAHNFVTRSLSHTTFTHTIFHTLLCHTHTPSFFVTHHLSHSTLSHTHNCFNFSILHHLLCLSFLLRPCYNLWRSLLEEVALWGYPVLLFIMMILSTVVARGPTEFGVTTGRRIGAMSFWRNSAIICPCQCSC